MSKLRQSWDTYKENMKLYGLIAISPLAGLYELFTADLYIPYFGSLFTALSRILGVLLIPAAIIAVCITVPVAIVAAAVNTLAFPFLALGSFFSSLRKSKEDGYQVVEGYQAVNNSYATVVAASASNYVPVASNDNQVMPENFAPLFADDSEKQSEQVAAGYSAVFAK